MAGKRQGRGMLCVNRPLLAPHCQVCVPKMDVLVVYCPSLSLLDAISIPTLTVLRQGESRL
jgi:hypothetical protein